jgi:hypothetical protein
MKYIKRFNESINFDFIKGTYTINPDGSYDVEGDVNLSYGNRTEIPLKFNNVSGDFTCSHNRLTSLKGCPRKVGGAFECHNNRELVNLEWGPEEVSGNFYCMKNKLTSLKGCPQYIGEDFICYDNDLTSLEGGPKEVSGVFCCSVNKLITLKGGPKKVGSEFDFENNNIINFNGFNCDFEYSSSESNPVHEIYKLCPTSKFIDALNEYSVIRGNKILLNRLEDALYQAEADDIDVNKLKFENYDIIK